MSQQPPDEPSNQVRPRFSRARQPRAQGTGHALLARGLHALDGKAEAAANRALRIARGRFASRPAAALRQAVSSALRSSANRPRHGRGNGVRAAGKHAQRVIVKARVVPVRSKSPAQAIREHLTYMARDSASRDGEASRLFNGAGELDVAAVDAFAERGLSCRHQFRFIVSPERGGDLDLEEFTRGLVRTMERDLGTRLDYTAAVHYDTDQPHVHLVVNGRDARGGDLVISRDYIGNGLRYRAMELATDALGYRSDLDILQSLSRDVHAERFTALDRKLQGMAGRHPDGIVDMRVTPADPRTALQRRLYLGRLAYLTDNGLAHAVVEGVWKLEPDALDRLRGLTRHREIQRQVERHFDSGERPGSIEVVDKANLASPVTGRVLGRGVADEFTGTPYLVVSGLDGKTYYAALSVYSERDAAQPARTGDLVTLHGVQARASGRADRVIVDLANRHGGIYDPHLHLRQTRGERLPYNATPERFVDAHVRRLEALVSRGLVTREPEGRYRIPSDLLTKMETVAASARDNAFIAVNVRGRDLRAQAAARAYTWLDEQLAAGIPQHLRNVAVRTRFQDDVVHAAEQRVRQLTQLGLAQVDDERLSVDPQLKTKLARFERDDAAARLRPLYGCHVDFNDARRFSGRVAAIEHLASGSHAIVVSGDRFTLVAAERGLVKLVGKDVALTFDASRSRDANQARMRFRVLDALDLSPSLGR